MPGIIMGALGGAGAAMQDVGSTLMKSELEKDRDVAKAGLERQNFAANADVTLQRQKALEEFKEQQKRAPYERLTASAQRFAGEDIPVEAKPVTHLPRDPSIIGGGMSGNLQELVAKAATFPVEDQGPYLDQLRRQYGSQVDAARAAVAGQTRKRTPDEALNAALGDAKINDLQAYSVGRTLANEKTTTVPKGAVVLDAASGKVIFSNAEGKEPRNVAVAPGSILVGADGQPIFANPNKEPVQKAPAGYRVSQDGNLEAIPGGPADLKLQGAFNADTAQLNGANSSFDRLAAVANDVLNHPGLNGITGPRGKLPNIPGSDAANAQALLETLKSQVGFGVLQDLRNSSKTGGALGAVSDSEGKRLEANLAALDRAQSTEQFKAQLTKIIGYTEQAKDRLRESFNLKHGDRTAASPAAEPGALPRVNNETERNALPSGAEYLAPDGSRRRKP